MYALNLGVEHSAQLAERGGAPALSESLRRLVPLSRQTLLGIRHYIYDLGPALLDHDTLIDMIGTQAREFQAISGIPTHVAIHEGDRPIPMPARVCLYRVLSEALSNVLKHSEASSVTITITADSESVHLSVKDDGVGFDPAETGIAYGLNGMRQRAEDIGGTFSVTSAKSAGVEVAVTLPL